MPLACVATMLVGMAHTYYPVTKSCDQFPRFGAGRVALTCHREFTTYRGIVQGL